MIRLLSFNLQHGRPGDGARLDPATAPLADSDIADAGAAREVYECSLALCFCASFFKSA